jgi:hypothetical protein
MFNRKAKTTTNNFKYSVKEIKLDGISIIVPDTWDENARRDILSCLENEFNKAVKHSAKISLTTFGAYLGLINMYTDNFWPLTLTLMVVLNFEGARIREKTRLLSRAKSSILQEFQHYEEWQSAPKFKVYIKPKI